jgi:hypothetical protein
MDKEYNYCLRCGRKLKNPKARQAGYGDVCLVKIQQLSKTPLFNINEERREQSGQSGNEPCN